ncbi:DUF2752 domain-containing protein [Lachnospiraceae bacterium OttesenSCG-928-D06]|nr:DUF2752 domain-containing protein [Lachnospiraceae bacterium OttesenSCG-928-D06]
MNKHTFHFVSNQREYQTERFLYKLGWVSLAILIVFYNFWLFLSNHHLIPTLPCVWVKFFGIYCPGCGGTRAFRALLSGAFLQSFFYHPLVIYSAFFIVLFMGSWSLYYLSKGTIKGLKFRPWYLYVSLIILILQWILKNIALYFGYLPI